VDASSNDGDVVRLFSLLENSPKGPTPSQLLRLKTTLLRVFREPIENQIVESRLGIAGGGAVTKKEKVRIDLVLLDLPVQSGLIQAQQPRGLRLVPAGFPQCTLNQPDLEAAHLFIKINRLIEHRQIVHAQGVDRDR